MSGGRTLPALGRVPASVLKEVGPRKTASLAAMGLHSVLDLLLHYPRRYVDRSHRVDIAATAVGEEAMVVGRVGRVSTRRPRRGRPLVDVAVHDETGGLNCTFFNQPWRAQQLSEGAEVALFGKVDLYQGRRRMTNPVLDVVGDDRGRQTGKVIAVYAQSAKAGVASPELSRYLAEVLERAGTLADPVPSELLADLSLPDRTTAFGSVHAPPEWGAQIPARRRLAFDELLRLQLKLVTRKRQAERQSRGIVHDVASFGSGEHLVDRFLGALPFALTTAQREAITEIARDLAQPYAMHRLLQGDVGAGKTVVALATLLFGIAGGYQGALMVPTEVLAEQHFLSARGLLAGLEVDDPGRLGGRRPLAVGLLTSRTTASERTRLLGDLASGALELLVGTHALLTEEVRFASLGVVVVDEQHRFGVEQRSALREKASDLDGTPVGDPDLLVMTATPIPRTAAMTVYGDLELTILDQLPAGRTPVRTRWLDSPAAEAAAWEKVRHEAAAGRQAYVVCPLVSKDESSAEGELATVGEGDDDDEYGELWEEEATARPAMFAPPPAAAPSPASPRVLRSATEEQLRLSGPAGELEGLAVGLLHGQMPAARKEEVMGAFRRGELAVLVATTVVEVGLDVTSATVMVVLDADRFGIAQLHQLRGRVGRGADRSYCYLVASEVGPEGERRLRALEASSDGFELAEVDLDLRGEGSVLGTRQKGRSGLRLASIRRDKDLVRAARAVAEAIVDEDPELAGHPLLAEELALFIGEEEAEFLFKS